jgi:uncharacterized protein YndB with AHSA1/START domain
MAGMDAGKAGVTIARSPEDVFRYLVELNDARWRRGVADMRLISDGYEGVGTRHVEVRRLLGRTIQTQAEVVAYEPNHEWAVRRATGPVRPQVTYTLTPASTGTRLVFGFDVPALHGAAQVLRPLVGLLRPLVERATLKDLRQLRAQLEAAAPRPGDPGNTP